MSPQPSRTNDRVVSFDDEPLILVDEDDNIVGFESKSHCHDGDGLLHRAFSIFVFNSAGEVLLQQRSAEKRLWPLYWSNSCCSHPRRGEDDLAAARRRIREELAISPDLRFLYKFRYQARFGDLGAEHELCSIYATVSDDPARVNVNEIAACEFVDADSLDAALAEEPDAYTPWLRLEWPRIRERHWDTVKRLIGSH